VLDQLMARAPELQSGKATGATGPDDDQVRVLCVGRSHKSQRGVAVDEEIPVRNLRLVQRHRPLSFEKCPHLFTVLMCGNHDTRGAEVCEEPERVDSDDLTGERLGKPDGPPDGVPGVRRSVDPDEDPAWCAQLEPAKACRVGGRG